MNQGRCAEALDVISFVYDWFTEGFETGTLRRLSLCLRICNVTWRLAS